MDYTEVFIKRKWLCLPKFLFFSLAFDGFGASLWNTHTINVLRKLLMFYDAESFPTALRTA